jgi:hypothetical protein
MSQTLQDVLQSAQYTSDGVVYSLLKLHPRAVIVAASIVAEIADPFLTIIVDKHETTLIIPAPLVEEFEARLKGHIISQIQYRLITLETELEPTLIGLMATIAKVLAEQHISILALSAFSRDHFLVPAGQFDQAMATLTALKNPS